MTRKPPPGSRRYTMRNVRNIALGIRANCLAHDFQPETQGLHKGAMRCTKCGLVRHIEARNDE